MLFSILHRIILRGTTESYKAFDFIIHEVRIKYLSIFAVLARSSCVVTRF